ncbi:MAG: LamG domain-containing protein [Proteobacteria bacterium]|nr:MAG: LamG domain-containing protein [Pseudomonadota bacterium]
MTLGTPLAAGSYSLTATAKDVATNTSGSSAANAITIDTTAPTTITLNSFTTPTNVNTQAFTGTAEAGMGVKVYQGSTEIASTTANGSGVWSVSPSALADGTYTIKAQAFDPGGRVSSFTGTRSLTVDTVAPTVLSLTSTLADSTYGIGQVVPVSVVFSEAVSVPTGNPQLLMRTGASNTNAVCVTGAAAATRIFNYTVLSGNSSSDLDYVATNSLSGNIEDAAGNAAVLTLPAPGATNSLGANKAIVIDAVVATVTSVTSNKANGVYGPGNSMQIQMTFSRAVNVTGTPLLALNTTPAKNASYSGGSGSTVLTFDYTVASPDKSLDLDYASTSALSGGTIKDSVGNNANLTLPTTGSANSIGGSKNIEVAGDSSIPVLSASTSATNAYVDTAITPVNVNNSTGNDSTNDGRTITYTCFFDNTVNSTMDSGGTACTSLAAATFNTSTGILTWTPNSTQQSAFDTAKNYEFRVVGSSPANVSGTVYFTVRVIRPWTTTIGYDAGTAASYTFDSSLINHTGGTVSLLAKDQVDGQYESDWMGGMGGTERLGAPYYILKLGLNSYCGGHLLNCFGAGDQNWIPKVANRVKFLHFGGPALDMFPGNTQASSNLPTESNGEQKIGWTSYYFDGNDYGYHSNPVTDDFTINIWFKTVSTAATGDCTAFHHGAALVSGEKSSLTNDFGLALCDGFVVAGTGNSTTSTEKSIRSKYRHNDNIWHMATFTRTKSTGVFKLYVDGILQASDNNGSNTLSAPTNLYYGRHEPSSTYYVGYLDDLMIWNAALSDSEVNLVFERQNPRASGVFDSRFIDSGYAGAPWTSLTISTNQPNGKELPDNATSETSGAYGTISSGIMTGIKGLWHFNETSGNYMDRSGSSAHAATSSSTTGAAGKFGNAVSLNGAGQHVNLGNVTSTNFGTGSFSSSTWIRTAKVLGAGTASRIFSNGYNGFSNGWTVRVLDKYANFGIGCTGSAANCIQVKGSKVIVDNQWHHIVTVTDRTAGKVKLFVDGVQDTITSLADGSCGTISGKDLLISGCTSAIADKSITYPFFGTHNNVSEFFEGYIDEAAMWNRALSDAEALHLYKRGVTRVLAQVKTCANAFCSDDPSNSAWKGPDGTMQTYFSELNNNSVPSTKTGLVSADRLTINFADYGLNLSNRYLQYRLVLESDDRSDGCAYGGGPTPCSPEIRENTVLPDHYPVSPTIVYNTGTPFYTLNSLTETLGAQNCSEGMRYQLSVNNTNWYYHNGTTWVTGSALYSQGNTAAVLTNKAAEFSGIVGRGNLYVKAFLGSAGVTPCELNSLGLGGNTSY